jgi:GNAT superfamily N-acetyltransferase
MVMPDKAVRIEFDEAVDVPRLREQMLAVYLASHHDLQHDPWFSGDSFWERLVTLYAPSRGFGIVTAWLNDAIIGYAFGSPKDNSADIWQMVAEAMPDVPIHASEPIYFFREFAVSPDHQGRGCGHLLHDSLLKTRSERLSHLLVRPDNSAKQAYLHWGWRTVGHVQPFPDAPVMDAMVKILDKEALGG